MPEHEARAPLGPGECYPTVESDAVEVLRDLKDEARFRWRRTHVQLDSSMRRAARDGDDPGLSLEAHGEHLRALLDWKAAEATWIAARLGMRTEPPPRRQ